MQESRAVLERMGRKTLMTGAVLAGVGVLLGAFGAHALETRVTRESLELWKTGVLYQLIHALAMLAVGLLRRRSAATELRVAATLFGAGIALFSGSLYLLAFAGDRWIALLTPMGGVLLLAGWVALAAGVWRG